MNLRIRTIALATALSCALWGFGMSFAGTSADYSPQPQIAPISATQVSRTAVSLPTVMVTLDELNLRLGSSVSYGIVAAMPEGSVVSVLSRASNGWYQVVYKTYTGWANGAYLKATAQSLPPQLYTQDELNLRTGSSTAYSIIIEMPRGARVDVSARASNGWYKVTYMGHTGWASGSYLARTAPSTTQTRGPNLGSRVVLTFDDCPLTLSAFDAAVNFAAANNIGMVLAPTGACLSSFSSRYGTDIAARARAKGQWVINHSANHRDLSTLSCTAAQSELLGAAVRTNWGRPPFGALDAEARCAYGRIGMRIWTWTVDTRDWEVQNKSVIVSRASAARAGDTVLMHMQWQGFAPDSLRQIQSNLAARGLGICRAYRGTNEIGAVATTPRMLPDSLPC
ncbi:SH3 domain-containing protein [Glutamicibacter sp. NPDC087344]|uniref:SH3 domain-containing protein n=1 Tax=Glutamicibacter sp. NPDC087344 TaxID=3363994 RepID=UPI003814B0C1